jgi:hypothetical protein
MLPRAPKPETSAGECQEWPSFALPENNEFDMIANRAASPRSKKRRVLLMLVLNHG